MSAIRLVNSIPQSVASTAEFRLSQGSNQIARIGVHAGAQAAIPTNSPWSAQAVTTMSGGALESNVVTFAEQSILLGAQIVEEGGVVDFQLVTKPGVRPWTITLQNAAPQPVQFTLTQPGSPVQIVNVVDENNSGQIPTAQQWQAYAIVNGITTQTVTTANPNATITAVADNAGGSFTLVVS